jgi:hypothetical protein
MLSKVEYSLVHCAIPKLLVTLTTFSVVTFLVKAFFTKSFLAISFFDLGGRGLALSVI